MNLIGMDTFLFYLKQGFFHILDPDGLDHLLFVLAISAFFLLDNWRKLLILVTAFTVGHSVTLALAALSFIPVNVYWIELLIPITICITCINNILRQRLNSNHHVNYRLQYLMALFFGLIHGMGFSNFFSLMMFDTKSIALPLFSFNLGIEIGQLCIVASYLLMLFIVQFFIKRQFFYWIRIALSVFIFCISITYVIEKI